MSRKQSDNDNRSHERGALMLLIQVFMWRHINSDSSRLLFGLSCDGGTKLWPVVHWLRHYWAISVWGSVMPRHPTLGCFDIWSTLAEEFWRPHAYIPSVSFTDVFWGLLTIPVLLHLPMKYKFLSPKCIHTDLVESVIIKALGEFCDWMIQCT